MTTATKEGLPVWLNLDELAATDPDDLGWWRWRACADVDTAVFHPSAHVLGRSMDLWADARTVCDSCPVRVECLAWWLATTRRGDDIWAGFVGGCRPIDRKKVRSVLDKRRPGREPAGCP